MIICSDKSTCVNSSCQDNTYWGISTIINTNCNRITNFSWNNLCPRLPACPICDHTEACGLADSSIPGTPVFQCDTAYTQCNDCTGTLNCQANVGASQAVSPFPLVFTGLTVSKYCKTEVNFGNIPTSAAVTCSSCTAKTLVDTDCTNNHETTSYVFDTLTAVYCPPKAANVCHWFFSTNVPLICEVGYICKNHICQINNSPVDFASTGCPSGTVLLSGNCYELSHCPICSKTSYCQITKTCYLQIEF